MCHVWSLNSAGNTVNCSQVIQPFPRLASIFTCLAICQAQHEVEVFSASWTELERITSKRSQ